MRLSSLNDTATASGAASIWDNVSGFLTKVVAPIYRDSVQDRNKKSQMEYDYKIAALRARQPQPVNIGRGLPPFPGNSTSQFSASKNYLIPVLLVAGAGLVSFLIIKK